ncbi:hypothetical protein EVAR_93276_1 [Eumeta japonica]|uniref:Uncharacterized protein n=1 Tax=Eumeta variegata TaxID=151549 RepID=A0A4C1TZ22_EUMVA|nr:hypothetical protein EVAR_93276_1 [Eumeta japonica]
MEIFCVSSGLRDLNYYLAASLLKLRLVLTTYIPLKYNQNFLYRALAHTSPVEREADLVYFSYLCAIRSRRDPAPCVDLSMACIIGRERSERVAAGAFKRSRAPTTNFSLRLIANWIGTDLRDAVDVLYSFFIVSQFTEILEPFRAAARHACACDDVSVTHFEKKGGTLI